MESYKIKYERNRILHQPRSTPYILTEELGKAVEVAITLGMPLLLTGEPGTGKTKLAEKIALDLNAIDSDFRPDPFVFNTKTTSTAKDLFYSYDALRHFHDANMAKNKTSKSLKPSDYIELQALGKAIALTNPKGSAGDFLNDSTNYPQSSVVLIDEIDKAPRDFPNDILTEIENLNFFVKESGNLQISKNPNHRIVVVLTSNSDKTLPDAFLRRTIFYYIKFPTTKQLISIVNSHLFTNDDLSNKEQRIRQSNIKQLVWLFEHIRATVRKKKPATAELIAWIRILELQGFLDDRYNFLELKPGSDEWKALQLSYSILIKSQTDLELIKEMEITD